MCRSWMINNFPSSSFPSFFNHLPHLVRPAYYSNILILVSHVTSLFLQLSYHLTSLFSYSKALFSASRLCSISASTIWHLEPWSFLSTFLSSPCCAVSTSTSNFLNCLATLSQSLHCKSFPRSKNHRSAPGALVLTFISPSCTISANTTRHLELSANVSLTIAFKNLYTPIPALGVFAKATSRPTQSHLSLTTISTSPIQH